MIYLYGTGFYAPCIIHISYIWRKLRRTSQSVMEHVNLKRMRVPIKVHRLLDSPIDYDYRGIHTTHFCALLTSYIRPSPTSATTIFTCSIRHMVWKFTSLRQFNANILHLHYVVNFIVILLYLTIKIRYVRFN